MKKGLKENGFEVPAVPVLKQVEASEGQWPKMLALVSHTQTPPKAYAMRFDVAYKVSVTKLIQSGERHKDWLMLLDYTSESKVCDAHYLKGFRIRLGHGAAEVDAKRLENARCLFSVDGEPLVKEALFRDLADGKEIVLPIGKDECLFHAHTLIHPGKDEPVEADVRNWIGYILPNGSRIQARMDGVPLLEASVKVEIEFDLASYTTRYPEAV